MKVPGARLAFGEYGDAQYRIGGSAERVLAFLADAVAERAAAPRSGSSGLKWLVPSPRKNQIGRPRVAVEAHRDTEDPVAVEIGAGDPAAGPGRVGSATRKAPAAHPFRKLKNTIRHATSGKPSRLKSPAVTCKARRHRGHDGPAEPAGRVAEMDGERVLVGVHHHHVGDAVAVEVIPRGRWRSRWS
jgi:hypothetical protein